MDVDIQGDHIVPVTLGGKLYVFWALMEDKAKPAPPVTANPPTPAPSPSDDNVPDTGDPILDEINEVVYDFGHQQAATQTAAQHSEAPPQLGVTVRMSVAELNEGGWSASESQSEPVELDTSPFRGFVSFTANTSGAQIKLTMLCVTSSEFRTVATFRFNVGTTEFTGGRSTWITDWTGRFDSQTIFIAPDPAHDGGPLDVTRPNGTAADNQWFQISGSGLSKLQLYLIENGAPMAQAPVLNTVWAGSRVVAHRGPEPAHERPHVVFQDANRSFFMDLKSRPYQTIATAWGPPIAIENSPLAADKNYRFELFCHPFVNDFRTRLALNGIDGLLRPSDQPQVQVASISAGYSPQVDNVETPFPDEIVDFRYGSTYGVYNWELFFHVPLLIATRLSQEGRFDEARKWFHTIFDPTDGTPPTGTTNLAARYWKFRPFALNDDLASIQTALGQELIAWANGESQTPGSDLLVTQIAKWREDPFDPHALARLRIVAYQKAVVQKYVDNLISWGDQLFSQDSIEAINEATQLYLLALQILGPKPTLISDPTPDPSQSYKQLDDPPLGSFDSFANALVETEAIVPNVPQDGFECRGFKLLPATVTGTPYFCVPNNEKLFALWDTLADRLFKIRHCQNIEGLVRALPLFQPPIDPGLLVRAKAAGLDLGSVLNDLSVAAPPYRYAVLAARAAEYTSSVVGLGASLLSALEKKDAETLSQLRSTHEVANQESTREIRKTQLSEARENLLSTTLSLRSAEARLAYYESRSFMSPGEIAAMALGGVAEGLSIGAQVLKTSGSQTSVAPDAVTGGAGMASPVALVLIGASNVARASFGAGDALEMASHAVSTAAGTAATVASYQRRMEDWKHQANLAKLEIAQIEKQIVAAEVRVAMAEQELRLLEQQLRQSKDVERFLRTRFTNKDLYGWMVGQLSAVYYQAFKLAYEMARRAEKAFNFERAADQSFVKFGYWEGLRKGLLAGERLAQDLRRMDSAYHSQNKREYELTKTVSIAELDPDAFMTIREGVANGGTFRLDEARFDDDFPTHHLRRIKSANISVHCTPGPYQSVNGRLTMLNAETRRTPTAAAREAWSGAVSATATSTAQNDAGMFELNFRDDRYLPFEGAGAHAESPLPQWRFELMGGNEFPYDSISDVVLQLRYTAREGRTPVGGFTASRNTMWRVPYAFADAWQALKEGSAASLLLVTSPSSFPKGRSRTHGSITQVKLYVRCNTADAPTFTVTPPSGSASAMGGGSNIGSGAVFYKTFTFSPGTAIASTDQTWTITPSTPTIPLIQDLWISFTYGLT